MSSPPWQDRRFMFQTGKEVHVPNRKTSMSGTKAPSIAPVGGLSTLTTASSPKGESVASRFMFMAGKEVHEPSRKTSISGGNKATSPTATSDAAKMAGATTTAAPKGPGSTSTTASSAGSRTSPASRRRSSAASQTGLFSGLLAKTSGDEHNQRRQSWDDMKKA